MFNENNQDPFSLWCCSNELCLTNPFNTDQQQPQKQQQQTNYLNHLINYDSCSLGSACDQQDSSVDCRCCQAGCPPSPISLQQCLECNQSHTPSMASTGPSINEPDDLSSLPQNTHQNQPGSPIDQDIVWINKELEELIKCCCCDQPTQSETLPLHHADAHPTHHVNFDMLFNPSLNLPNRIHFDSSHHHGTPKLSTTNTTSERETPGVEVFRCQWKDCNLEFRDRLELTEHVNLCHLFHSTSIASNLTLQANDDKNYSKIHHSSSNLLTSHHNSTHPTISTTNLSSNHMDGLFLDSQSSTCSSFTHTPRRPSPSIQSFSDQVNSTSRRPHQDGLLSPNTSTLMSKSSCESIYDFLNQNPRISNSTSHNLVPDHPLQGNFLLDPHPSPSVASSTQPRAVESQARKESNVADTNQQQHVCRWESCTGKSFSTTAELTEHLSNNHIGSGKSNYVCLWENCYCDGKSTSSRSITIKEAPQQEEQVITMEENSSRLKKRKVFNQRQKVMRHLQTHTGDRPFECERCGKRFGEMATLVQHRRTHTQEKPYKCQVQGCEKSFALQSALTIHTRTHTGLKPFKCPVDGCHSHFSESSNLSKHLKIHDSSKKFHCHLCLKKFTRADQLQRHLKFPSTHHPINPPTSDKLNSQLVLSSQDSFPSASKRQKI